MKINIPSCARCSYKPSDRVCSSENGKAPDSCPTLNKKELIEKSLKEYEIPEILEFTKNAAIQEAEGYGDRELGYAHVRPCKTRIEEIMEFSKKMKYKRLGLAFCIGLRAEAKTAEKIFSSRGFEVVSAVCKSGRITKDRIGLTREQQIAMDKDETMCNPILQAMILNDEKTDFNILLGLCVGHDSLFLKYAQAPCTVLAVKDRVLGHNPLAAVYNAQSYYRSIV
ncbi:DUF1847 [Desulfonema limicola]|uniref:DUF1847 n=1 Tax=Desulfonema limicola TaxID=45656 RepID=A0A975GEF0_9BACT|nr:DUF1847 domain-containing protein [Desulfonema limicola]QTA78161.1 DUF1847 [Desulfonema limicola]